MENEFWKRPDETIEEYYDRTSTPDRPGEVVSTATLGSNEPTINVPPAPTDQTDYAGLMANIMGTNGATATSPTEPSGDWFQQFLGSATPPTSAMDDYSQLYGDLGIAGKETAVNEAQMEMDVLQAEMQGLKAEAQAVPIQLQEEYEGRGATKAGIQPLETGRLRKIALRALPLQTLTLMAQAKLTGSQNALKLAQDRMDTLFQIKRDDADRQYEYNKEVRGMVFDYLTASEKKQLDAIQKEDDRKYAEKTDRLEEQRAWITEAINSGQSDLVTEISKLDPEDEDFEEKLNVLKARIQAPEAEAKTQIVEVGGRKKLINTQTGDVIKDLGASDIGDKLKTQVIEVGGKKILINSETGEIISDFDGAGTDSSTSNLVRAATTVVRDANDALYLIGAPDIIPSDAVSGVSPIGKGTGISFIDAYSRGLKAKIKGTSEYELQSLISSIKSNVGIDTLLNIKREGSGLGQVPQSQLETLQEILGRLDIARAPELLIRDIRDINTQYQDIIRKAGGEVGTFNVQTMPDGSQWQENADGTFTKIK